MENYYVDTSSIEELLWLWKGKRSDSAILDCCYEWSLELFAFRFWKADKAGTASWLPVERGFTGNGRADRRFELKKYLKKFFLKNGLKQDEAKVLSEIAEIKGKLVGDIRNWINFHDFAAILTIHLRNKKVASFTLSEFQDAFRLLFRRESLVSFTLFQKLLVRFE